MRRWRPNLGEYIFAAILVAVGISVFKENLSGSGIVQSAYNLVQNAGVAATRRTTINFTGGGCVDNPGNNSTDCPGGATQFSQTNDVTDSVITTETSLTGTGSGTNVLPANFFCSGSVTGTALNVYISGRYSTTAAPTSIRMRLKTTGGATGTVVLGDTGVETGVPVSVTNGFWQLWTSITCRTGGVGGTLSVQSGFNMYTSSLSSLTPSDSSMTNAAVLTVDTTATQTIDLTAVWGAAGQSITSTNYVLAQPSGGGGSSVSSQSLCSNYVATDESTASAAFVDLATLDSCSFTLSAVTNVLTLYMADEYVAGGAFPAVQQNIVNVDGADVGGIDDVAAQATLQEVPGISKFRSAALAAGAHTIKIRHRVGNGGGTMHWLLRTLWVQSTP